MNNLIEEALSVASDALLMLKSDDLGWRWLKGQIRRRLWKPYLKPAIKGLDKGWIDDALAYIALIRLLIGTIGANPEMLEQARTDPEAALRRAGD